MADVFISYSRKDKDFVKALHAALSKQNREAWVDWEDIPLTADWWQEIEQGIETADTFIFVLSSDSVGSPVCNEEIEHAVKNNKRLIPIVRRDDFLVEQVCQPLRKHNWLFFRECDDFDSTFQTLLDAIDTDLDHVHAHTRLLVRAIEWDGKGRDESYLLRGRDLRDADRWLTEGTGKDPQPTQLQTQYIFASGKAEIHRQRRKQTYTTVGLVGAIGLAVLAFTQYRQAEQRRIEAERGQITALSASSSAFLASNRELEALIEGLKAGQQIKRSSTVDDTTKTKALFALQQIAYAVRERNRLDGHSDWVEEVAVSPDGNMIATASDDRTIKLWTREGNLLKTLRGHRGYVYSVSFSSDGKMLASASRDKTIKLWNLQGTLLKTLKGHQDRVNAVRFSPNNKIIASVSRDRTIKLWKLDGTLLKTLRGHQDNIISFQFSPSGQEIATVSSDRTARLWSLDRTLITTFKGHTDEVNSVSFSPDGQTIATASNDKTTKLWKIDGTLLRTLEGHSSYVNDVSFSPDGQTVATAGSDTTIKLWKPDGTLISTLKGHGESVNSIQFAPNGKELFSASNDATVKLWRLNNPLLSTVKGHAGGVGYFSFAPLKGIVATSHWDDQVVKLWDLKGSLHQVLKAHRTGVEGITFSPDGQMIATAGSDLTVRLWRHDGTLLKTLAGYTQLIVNLAFSQDGQIIATSSKDKVVRLWNKDGTLLKQIQGPREWGDWYLEFSPDIQYAIVRSDRTAKLWRIRDHALIKTFKGHTAEVLRARFSLDGQTVITTSWDKTIKLWKLDGTLISTLTGHNAVVADATFSPDGQLIASTSNDKTIRLWKRDGTPLMTLQTEGVTNTAKFSPDGKWLGVLSGINNLTLTLWDLSGLKDLDALIMNSCQMLDNYLVIHPVVLKELEVCQNPSNLVATGQVLANSGDVEGATNFLRKAKELDAKITFVPETEAKRFATLGWAQTLVEEARNLAQQEDVEAAIAKFQQAQGLNPTLKLNSKLEALQLANQSKSQRLIDDGRDLAEDGKIPVAIEKFKEALKLDKDLSFNPTKEVNLYWAQGLVEQGIVLSSQGNIAGAIVSYNQADALNTGESIPASRWNALCRNGSLWNHAAKVLTACNKTIMLYPGNGDYHDSRGLARAMTGDIAGAIEDLKIAINWANDDDKRTRQQRWLKALQNGQNPITAKELETLREKELVYELEY